MSNFKSKINKLYKNPALRRAMAKTMPLAAGAGVFLIATGASTAIGAGLGAPIAGFGAVGGLQLGAAVGVALGACLFTPTTKLVGGYMDDYLARHSEQTPSMTQETKKLIADKRALVISPGNIENSNGGRAGQRQAVNLFSFFHRREGMAGLSNTLPEFKNGYQQLEDYASDVEREETLRFACN